MKKVLFVDLDNTLFQTKRKCDRTGALKPVAFLRDGRPISFARRSQLGLLELFQREMIVVPATARNMDAYSRVAISFFNGAILDHGGIILLPDGSPDQIWLDLMRTNSLTTQSGLEELRASILDESSRSSYRMSVRIIEDFGIPFYIVVKSPSGDEAQVHSLSLYCRQVCDARGLVDFSVHCNGNNLSVLPPWLDKKYAVRRVLSKLILDEAEVISLGMGDSISDLGFLGECDYAIVPTGSQLALSRFSTS